MHTEQYEAKHETHFIHDGGPSYDPAVYGGSFIERFHIKTVQVRSVRCLPVPGAEQTACTCAGASPCATPLAPARSRPAQHDAGERCCVQPHRAQLPFTQPAPTHTHLALEATALGSSTAAGAGCAQVYEHHCQRHLPPPAQRLRAAAMYLAANAEAVRWGLEICGFQDCAVDFYARPIDADAQGLPRAELFASQQPVLCHLHCSVHFSL